MAEAPASDAPLLPAPSPASSLSGHPAGHVEHKPFVLVLFSYQSRSPVQPTGTASGAVRLRPRTLREPKIRVRACQHPLHDRVRTCTGPEEHAMRNLFLRVFVLRCARFCPSSSTRNVARSRKMTDMSHDACSWSHRGSTEDHVFSSGHALQSIKCMTTWAHLL